MRERLSGRLGGLPDPRRIAEQLLTSHWTPFVGALGVLAVIVTLAVALALATKSDANDPFVLQSYDGARFVAETSGEGDEWVLLGHMYRTKNTNPTNRFIWNRLAERLVAEGYKVLRWDFRCHGDTPCVYSDRQIEDVPEVFLEWEAAIDYAVEEGAQTIYGVGVSMGGTSLMQVAAYRNEFAAVSAISSPNIFPNKAPSNSDRGGSEFDRLDGLATIRDVQVPKLYMVGARNQCAYWQSNRYFQRAGEPTRFVIYDTDLHGTEILDDDEMGPDAVQELVDFLDDPYGILGKEKRNLAPDADPNTECWPPDEDDDQREQG